MSQKKNVIVKVKPVNKLIKELDRLFSLFIRLTYSDKDGNCNCYTCGYATTYKKLQAGHYVSRYYKATRWDERNVRPQCHMCNLWKKGNTVMFRYNLVNELGEDVVKELEESVHTVTRGTVLREQVLEGIQHYTTRLALLGVK